MFSNRERERGFILSLLPPLSWWLMWLLGLVRFHPAAFISISDQDLKDEPRRKKPSAIRKW